MSTVLGVPQFNTPIDDVEIQTTIITAAQFKAFDTLTSDSIAVTPKPAANQLIQVVSADVNMQFIAPAYATGTGNFILGFDVAGTTSSTFATSGQSGLPNASIKLGSSVWCIFGAMQNFGNGSALAGKALLANIDGGPNFTAGNSIFVVRVRYRIVTIA